MRKTEATQERPVYLKRKMMAALAMLLVATVLLMATSYAWLVLSIAPEVGGISTNIGANGSLEIALLNTATRQDLSAIKTAIGKSLANRVTTANNTWGNLVDLSDESYGLNTITLLPARLNVVPNGDGYTVDSGMLSIPDYGYDGRIVDLTDDTISAVYDSTAFSYVLGTQDYGVRAIGTTNSLSVQGSALATAKSNISTYTNSASNAASSALDVNGGTLFDIMLMHATNAGYTYSDTHLDALKNMLKNLQNSLDYIDLALRQGMVAVAASQVGDEDAFTRIRDRVLDTGNELSDVLADLKDVDSIPASYIDWIDYLDETQNDLNAASNSCNALSGGSYSWGDFQGVLTPIMNVEKVYINDTLYPDFDKSSAGDLLGTDIVLTLAPGSGVFANIADFTDDYNAWISAIGSSVEITTSTVVDTPYLKALAVAVKSLEAADGSTENETAVPLTATYGYALDLAFRSNAPASNLLLQTAPEQRVYSDSTSASTMGGGSYMEFTSTDDSFTLEKRILLMDSVRVGFLDDQSNLLGVAKLNTSNRTVIDGVVKAPLYLYAYEFSSEDGSMIMGERKKADNTIASLQQNVAKAVTVIVWLDGDVVDNTMVSAAVSTSLSGNLNLQFASDANLIPAANSDLMNITADKTALDAAVLSNKATIEAGQGTYTSISWNAYAAAYNYAVSVNNDANATEAQIYNAALNLAQAKNALEKVSHDAILAKIGELRTFMGETDDLACYVIEDKDGSYRAVSEYTQAEAENWNEVGVIHRVDYANNLNDEGNDIYTPIYTDESWTALAAALYDAEAVEMNAEASDVQLNNALTAMNVAYDALQRKVFYKPYEYNGSIYYFAISDETDTYGKWYDSDFKRIVSDRTVLSLDAHAEAVDIAVIEQNSYVAADTEVITPYINILDKYYPELSGEEVIAAAWNELDPAMFTEIMGSRHITILNSLIKQVEDEELDVDTTAAEKIVERTDVVSAAEAESVISALQGEVNQAIADKQKNEAEASADMTADQRILLTTAVNSAKSVTGYEDVAKTELAALRNAVAEAESLLSMETGATKNAADEALTILNGELTKHGKTAVTAANTLTYSIPVGSERYDIVYAVEYPGVSLELTGKTGTGNIGAIVLTKNGVIFTVTKTVTVYTPCDGAIIGEPLKEEEETVTKLTSKQIAVGETVDLAAYITYDTPRSAQEIALGNVVTGTNGKETVVNPEIAETYTWASDDVKIATVSGKSAQTCTINALSVGTTTITVSIGTAEGNAYTTAITLTVTAAP